MQVQTAVNKMMLSIKIEETIPAQYYSFLRTYLHQIYVVGYEQGRQEINQHGGKCVGQFNKEGKLINTYKTLREAQKKTGFTPKSIWQCIKEDRPSRQGWRWQYLSSSINKKEGALTDTL